MEIGVKGRFSEFQTNTFEFITVGGTKVLMKTFTSLKNLSHLWKHE
jgi:hypothetical protein